MFENNIPYFKNGNILKKSMLLNLRDYPRKFIDIYFQDFSDGIIAGSNIFLDNGYFCVDKGVVKYNGIIYILEELCKIRYENTNKEMIVKIRFLAKEEKKDFKIYSSDIILDDDLELKSNEIELGRFKLREGAKLRSTYKDFMDFSTEFNTINIINVPYANIDEATLHPLIVRFFAKKILELNDDNLIDYAFALECLNSRVINRILLENYLKRRLNLPGDNYSNLDIYNYMNDIIKSLSGMKTNHSNTKKIPKIIVD
ncbi:DNA and RNA helicase [Natronospora cellulosivora (SeqCode)]